MTLRLVGFAGRAGSGKTTAAKELIQRGFTRWSFAGPLKAGMVAMGFPEPPTQELKEQLIPGFEFSWRDAAQKLGTEWGRALDTDLWVKLAEFELLKLGEGNFVFDDVRFENEAAMIRRLGGHIVHLSGRKADMAEDTAKHASERGIARAAYGITMDNSEGVSMPERIQSLLERLGYV